MGQHRFLEDECYLMEAAFFFLTPSLNLELFVIWGFDLCAEACGPLGARA